jgi:outer membrane protein TolC
MKIINLLLIGVFTFSSLRAQVLQLEDAVTLALGNNHGVLVAKQMEEFTKTGIHSGAVGLLPTIEASAGGSYNYSVTDQEFNLASIPPTKNQEAAQNNQATKVSAYYLIFNGGGRLKAFEKLKTSGELSKIQTKISVESTLIEVVNRYYEVVRLSKEMDLINVSMGVSRDRLTRVVANYEFGNVGKIEMLSAQVDYNNDSSKYVSSKLNRRAAMNELNYLLGRTISTDFKVETDIDLPQVFSADSYIDKAKSNNTSIILSNIQLDMAELDRKISSSKFMPILTTNIDYGYVGSVSDVGVFKSSSSLGYTGSLSLKWNLFDGMKKNKNSRTSQNK